jgi:AcrR family transcriptional regulator
MMARVAGKMSAAPTPIRARYSRFSGKQGLLEALFIKGFEGLHQSVGSAAGPDARARLRDAALRYRSFALAHPQHYALMFEPMHEVEPGEEARMRAFEAFHQLVVLVGDARALGPFGEGTDVEVAQQLWSALHGSVSLELLGIRFDDDPTASFARLVDALLAGMVATGAGPGE